MLVVGAALGFAAVLFSVNFKKTPLVISETTKKSVIKVIPYVKA